MKPKNRMEGLLGKIRLAAVRRFALIVSGVAALVSASLSQPDKATINLAGLWRFSSDPRDVGVTEEWFNKALGESIRLPGSMAEQGKGDDISTATQWTGGIVDRSWFTDPRYEKYRRPGNVKVPFWLNPVKAYAGAAWYQREIRIPRGWSGKHIELLLERCHWETRLWVDGREAGVRNSLATPHVYDLSFLRPGPHRLTVRIDNRIKEVDVGRNAHSVTDHTQTNWNGIVGTIELRAKSLCTFESASIVPHVRDRKADVRLAVRNLTGNSFRGVVEISARLLKPKNSTRVPAQKIEVGIGTDSTVIDVPYSLGSDALLWDEFSPNLYELQISLKTAQGQELDRTTQRIGLREFSVAGTRFSINGRPVFLRGTLECAIFPRTGYASTDPRDWQRIFRICKAHGLNHVRFHSWCPPEAAFTAADEAGIYLYVECCAWTRVGDGALIDRWLYDESERIVRAYGNHPSFCMMSYGNEPSGDNQEKFLGQFVSTWREKDRRRVYTSGAGWPLIPESDLHLTYRPRIQAWGAGLHSIINQEPPRSNYDFRDVVSEYDKPVVSHEIGQWCVYPNYKEIRKYTGVLRAKNFEIFQESLRDHGMEDQAEAFLHASGRLQVLCYKADIEAALRTPGMAGFELLDLHDFPGQGTALVGVLDPFWDEKGYVTAKEYSRFCNSTVPLARLQRMVFLNDQELTADIEVAHFGSAPLWNVTPRWRIHDQRGRLMAEGTLNQVDVPIGNAFPLGAVKVPLDGWPLGKMNLEVSVGGFSNDWDFWVYPSRIQQQGSGDILVSATYDEGVREALGAGKSVLLLADTSDINSDVPPGFSSIFWNTAWTSRQPPHTLGILCNPQHPAFTDFPTDFHSNWQWWDLIVHSRAMVLDSLPGRFRPLVQVVDDWFTNRKLGLVFEATVGKGKLVVCSIDLSSNLDQRPVARQLRTSLLRYMGSRDFSPRSMLTDAEIRGIVHYAPAKGKD